MAHDAQRAALGDYRGYRVSSNQPPGGGVVLLEMLNILEHFALAGLEHNSAEYMRVVAETMKRATIDKDRHVGDPRSWTCRWTGSPARPTRRGSPRRSAPGRRRDVPRFNAGAPGKDTTQVSVVDGEGNCVTMTHSLGMPSGVVTAGLGFMYNGCMGVFDPRPGRAGSLAPGKARFSSVVPSIVLEAIGRTW